MTDRWHIRRVSDAIPPYDALMVPVLRYVAERTWVMRPLIEQISDDLRLASASRERLLPGGSTTVIQSRVPLLKTCAKKAGLVDQRA